MMKRLFLCMAALAVITIQIQGQRFLDTSAPSQFFTVGARVGINTSNCSFPTTPSTLYNNNSWGTGFDAGVIANLNIREYLSIQPGLFFESRSGNYSYLYWYYDFKEDYQEYWDMGHQRSYNFTIPVMAIVKFKIMDKFKPMAEFGPYFQYTLKHNGDGIVVPYQVPQTTTFSTFVAKHNNFDFGFKMGIGLQFFDHYYFGVHYLAGASNSWKEPQGGKNKEWSFTIGYDF